MMNDETHRGAVSRQPLPRPAASVTSPTASNALAST